MKKYKLISIGFLRKNKFNLDFSSGRWWWYLRLTDEHNGKRNYITFYDINIDLDAYLISVKETKKYKTEERIVFAPQHEVYKQDFLRSEFTAENFYNIVKAVTKNSETVEPKFVIVK